MVDVNLFKSFTTQKIERMLIFFRVLSVLYIAGIFLLADSSVVEEMAAFNPYSLLHIPLYGILTLLLVLSFSPQKGRVLNSTNPSNPSNPSNPINLFVAGVIALVVAVADEVHQAYLPNRNASVTDVLLDITGMILCVLIMKWIEDKPVFHRIGRFLRQKSI